MTTTDSLAAVTSFYDKANLCLRMAIFVALTWPLSALVLAMLVSPTFSQTMVPLIDMIPILAAILIVLAAPFGLVLLLQDPLARKGFLYLAGLIGLELTIGVYLSIVPVSQDTGLIPLLILTALALFFLRVANVAPNIRALLGFILVGITIIFISGGRAAMKTKFNPPVAQVVQPSPRTLPPPVTKTDRQTSDELVPVSQPPSLPAPRQPKPFVPDWSNARNTAVGQLEVLAAPCIRRAGLVHCFFRITNRGKEFPVEIANRDFTYSTRIIDDLGDEYKAAAVKLGASDYPSRALTTIPPDVPILGSATFEDVTGSKVAFLEIIVALPGNEADPIRINDLDIVRESP